MDFSDPDGADGKLAEQLKQDYGFSPQIASLVDPKPFWFYMLLQGEDETLQVPLPAELDQTALKKSIESAIQRMAPGYLKTVAMVTPSAPPAMNPYMPPPGGKKYEDLREALSENVRVKNTDLKDGHVPADADMLLLLSPENLDKKQLFAVDQFLMQGGSVVIAASPFDVVISDSLKASKTQSGMEAWLKHQGLTLGDSMVLDPQNASLPVPVRRQLGPIAVNEIKMMPYPHFPDIRNKGLNKNNPMTASLGQLSLNWASPIHLDADKNKQREVVELLHTSNKSWTSSDLNVLPDYEQYPGTGFPAKDERASRLVAVAVKGRFESYFKGKPSPLLEKEKQDTKAVDKKAGSATDKKTKNAGSKDKKNKNTVVSSSIERSSDSARIILISSNSFASDDVLSLASQGQGSLYTRPLEFMQNAIDWSLDDTGLMAIRSRAQLARLLKPMQHGSQLFWEYLNYVLALAGLLGVGFLRRSLRKKKQAHYGKILAEV